MALGKAAIVIAAAALVGCATVAPGCRGCPGMAVVPAGAFLMGSPDSEPGRFPDEGPQHQVRFARPFELGRAPVTRAQYAAFVAATGHVAADGCSVMTDAGEWRATPGVTWRNPGFAQTDADPVVCVSWRDAIAYAGWLSRETGRSYRLPSEAEFEYTARAGAGTAFPWGHSADGICARANGFDAAARRDHPDWPGLACDDGYSKTAPVDAFPANRLGLLGMTGNVFQWTADCFVEGYAGAPADGSARLTPDCVVRVIRGGSWLNGARGLRAAMRDRDPAIGRYTNIGFRLARSLP